MLSNLYFLLLNISFIFLIIILLFILKIKNKAKMHYAFLALICSILLWTFGYLGLFYWHLIFGYDLGVFIKIVFTGVILTPLSIFFLGYLFAYTNISFTLKFKLLFVIPLLSLLIVYTNEYHGLFYKYFSANDIIFRSYGPWTVIHIPYSYALILIGLWHLIYFIIKNSGFFSKQSRLVIAGITLPLLINVLITFRIGNLPYYFEAVSFSFAVICFAFAIFRYNFLSISPIALQNVVDRISDSFVVVNEELKVIDYNKTFTNTFNDVLKIERNIELFEMLESNNDIYKCLSSLTEYFNEIQNNITTIYFNTHLTAVDFDKHFTVEITPIATHNIVSGTIILFKDITQSVKDLETIKEKQAILIEQERLASLGQLIGGIAHNLKTPIMSIAGGLEGLKDLIKEYEQSIEDESITHEDHQEIAAEMLEWLDKIKPHCSYMSDVITTVKGQAVQLSISSSMSFTIDDLIKRINILMKHELLKYNCVMNIDFHVDKNTELQGEVNPLVQIFDNLIINAIHSYEGKSGTIDLKAEKSGDNIEFSITDYGKGISEKIKDRLFKEMVTTKGKNGTGLGLYMSYSTIKGRFSGNMWFTSTEGEGTTFYISLPCLH